MKTVDVSLNGRPLCRALNANRFFTRLRGLIGRKLGEGGGLLLTPCDQVHTFMMGYAIDVVYLDKAGAVLRVDDCVPRGKCLRGCKGAHRVLELRAGAARAGGVTSGSRLTVLPDSAKPAV